MFRSLFSLSRVLVVVIVVFAFAAVSLPAYAAPFAEGKAAAKAESGWFEAAVAWVSQVIFGDQPVRAEKSPNLKPLTGSCVDPLGRCG